MTEEKAPIATADDSSIASFADGAGGGSLSVSSDVGTVSAAAHRSYVTKSYLQKNELVNEVQRLRIELKQRSDDLEHMRAQLTLEIDDREDKIEELRRENGRLRTTISKDEKIATEEARLQDETLKQELATLIERVRAMEDMNNRLSEDQAMAKQRFRLIKLTDEEYKELKSAELKNDLSLSEMVSLRVYEEIRNISQQLDRLTDDRRRLEEETQTARTQIVQIQRELQERMEESEQLRWTNTRLEKRLASLLGPGAVSMHESIAVETSNNQGSKVETEISRLRCQLDTVTEHLTSERERLVRELDSAREALRVSVDEGTMLRRQAIDAGQRSVFLEERVSSLSAQIDTLKSGREEMLEKYLASKEESRTEFNERLIRELDELRSKNTSEYERLHRQMKEVFESESTALHMAKDAAISERDRALAEAADARSRYEAILVQFKNLEFSLESQTADLVSQLRVKTFEMDRLKTLLDETDANLRTTKDAYEAVRAKFDALFRDHQNLCSESGFQRKKLEEELEIVRQKLTVFERTEVDLDDLVMQAADTAIGDNEAERVLMSYGVVTAAPPSFRRRLEQSVRLARRVLELERTNNSLRSEYEKKANDATRLSQEVADLNNLLSISRHPDQKLIVEALKARDEELRALKARLRELELELEAARHEMKTVAKERSEMTKDMQTLLSHRDEMAQIRQQLTNTTARHGCYSPSFLKRPQTAGSEKRPNSQRKSATAVVNAHIAPPVLLN